MESVNSKKLFFIVTLFFMVFLSFLLFFQKSNPNSKIKDHQKITLQIAERKLEVEVVNTPESITRGLSAREQLGSDGMLFILPQRVIPRFWMKDMRFNLDLLWIDGDKIIDLTANVPAPKPNTKLQDLPIYSPQLPADKVLELKSSKIKELGIKTGDKLLFL